MANIKSQKKRIKLTEKQHLRNKSYKSALKTEMRKAKGAIESKNTEEATKHVFEATKTLDIAAQKGIIHQNNAANKKSRLVKALNKLSQKPTKKAATKQKVQ